MELQKVEPMQPVHVEIEYPVDLKEYVVFHHNDMCNVEQIENTSTESVKEDGGATITFESNRFSVFTVATISQFDNYIPISNNQEGYDALVHYANGTKKLENNQCLRLEENVWVPNNWETGTITVNQDYRLDLNGFVLTNNKTSTLFNITEGNVEIISSKKPSESSFNGSTVNNGVNTTNKTISFNIASNKGVTVSNVGILVANAGGDVVKVTGGSLTMENIAVTGVNNASAVYEQSRTVTLNNCYLVNGKRGLYADGGSVTIKDGYIANNSTSGGFGQAGAAIQAINHANICLGNDVVENNTSTCTNVQYNRFTNAESRSYGGAIHLRGSELTIKNALIQNNEINGTDWVCGGAIAALCNDRNNQSGDGNEWTWGTPSKITMYEPAKVDSNSAQAGGGGIFLQGPRIGGSAATDFNAASKLFMYGGTISNNTAKNNEGGGIHQAATYSSYAYLLAGTIANNRTNTTVHWGGGGAFVGESSYMMLPNGASVYSNDASGLGGGIAACSTGNIIFDEKVVIAQNTSSAANWTGDGTSKPYDRDYARYKEGFKNPGDARDFFSCLYASVSAQLPGDLGGANWSGSVDYNLVSNINNGTLTANQLMGLINNAASDKQDAALGISPLKIYDNYSNIHGGGILVNGYLVGGEVEFLPSGPTISFQANKQLQNKDGKPISLGTNRFEFDLLENDRVIATGTNDADGLVKFAPPVVYMPVIDPNTASNGKVIETTATYILKERPNSGSSYQMSTEEYQISIRFKTTLQYVLTYPVFNENGTKIKDVSVFRADTAVMQDSLTVTRKSDGAILTDSSFTQVEGVGSMNNWSLALSPGNDPDFINKELPKKTITVKKLWQDSSGNTSVAPENTSVLFKLLRRETGSEGEYEVTDQTVTLPHDDKWEYTFENLDAKYDYKIQEVFDNPLYESTSAVTIGTSSRNVWVKAKSISDGQSYLIGSKDSNGKIVLLKGTASAQKGRVNASDKVTLDQTGETVQIGDDVFAESFEYTPEEDLLFTADTSFPFNQGSVTVLCSSNRTYTRAEEWGGGNMSGLMLSDSNGMKQEGGHLQIDSNGQISQKRRNTDTEFKKYLYDTGNNWFSSETQTNISSGNSVYLYEQKSITREDPTHSIWTFTNKRKSSYQIKLLKIDGETKAPLNGVEFELYEDSGCTSKLKFRYDNGIYQVSPEGQITILRTDKDGNIALSGFAAGTYYLKETSTLEGYTPIEVKPIVVSEESDGFDGTHDMVVNATVENFIAYELPETGSAGTKIYTAAGTILLLTGTSLYRYKRRRNRKGGETH